MKFFACKDKHEGEMLPTAYLSFGWLRGDRASNSDPFLPVYEVRGFYISIISPISKHAIYERFDDGCFYFGAISQRYVFWFRRDVPVMVSYQTETDSKRVYLCGMHDIDDGLRTDIAKYAQII